MVIHRPLLALSLLLPPIYVLSFVHSLSNALSTLSPSFSLVLLLAGNLSLYHPIHDEEWAATRV